MEGSVAAFNAGNGPISDTMPPGFTNCARLCATLCKPRTAKTIGKPCVGNPHARFERGAYSFLA